MNQGNPFSPPEPPEVSTGVEKKPRSHWLIRCFIGLLGTTMACMAIALIAGTNIVQLSWLAMAITVFVGIFGLCLLVSAIRDRPLKPLLTPSRPIHRRSRRRWP